MFSIIPRKYIIEALLSKYMLILPLVNLIVIFNVANISYIFALKSFILIIIL